MAGDTDVFNILGNDDEDDYCESLQSQALFVPPVEENEDLSGPPMDGFQFLKRVVMERKMCDGVIVKEVETKPLENFRKQIPDFPENNCRPEFFMDKETQLKIVSEFSRLRLNYEARRALIPEEVLHKLNLAMPAENDEAAWLRIFSIKPPNLAETMDSHNSSVELCLAISQLKISRVMESMEYWIEDGDLSIPLACQWVYTLMTCVALPLDPDVCATLRAIARVLMARRSQLESVDSEELPHINIVICIIGRYFEQYDLADHWTDLPHHPT